jgi:hypothetical protein
MIRHRPCERVGMPCRDPRGRSPVARFDAYHVDLPGGRVTPRYGVFAGSVKMWVKRDLLSADSRDVGASLRRSKAKFFCTGLLHRKFRGNSTARAPCERVVGAAAPIARLFFGVPWHGKRRPKPLHPLICRVGECGLYALQGLRDVWRI